MAAQLREIRFRLQLEDTQTLRTEQFAGREYLVAPVIMIQEGVLHGAGAQNAEFCPGSELEKLVVQWNGRPIVLNHPQIRGVYVSANDPQVLEGWAFGYVFNTQYSDAKLKAEAWIDTVRANELGGKFKDVVDRIQEGKDPIEVSTGLYTDVLEEEGTFQGRRYSGRWMNIVSDHLAILPDTIGACSVADGCGIPRLNQDSAPEVVEMRVNEAALRTYTTDSDCGCGGTCESCGGHSLTEEEKQAKILETLAKQGINVNAIAPGVMLDDAYGILNMAVKEKYSEAYDYTYVISMSSDAVVYCAYWDNWDQYGYFQVPFNMDAKGNVTFTGEPQEVVLMTQVNPKPKVQEGTEPTKDPKTNGVSNGTGGLGDEGGGGTDTINTPPGSSGSPSMAAPDTAEEDDAAQQRTIAEAVAAGSKSTQYNEGQPQKQKVQTVSEFLATAPPEIQKLLKGALQVQEAKKANLIKEIKSNKANKFTDEQLAGFDLEVLEPMAELARVNASESTEEGQRVNYRGRGGAAVESSTGETEQRNNSDENAWGAPSAPRVFEQSEDTHRVGSFKKH